MLGNTEGEIDVDFSRVVRSDNETGSRFEVGGRVYWEAYVTSDDRPEFQSFVTNGFFDREGYVEPTLGDNAVGSFVSEYLIIIIGVLLVVSIIIC